VACAPSLLRTRALVRQVGVHLRWDFRYRPGAEILLTPERPSGMAEKDFDATLLVLVEEKSCAPFAG
jgi:hypothetical protein